MKSFNQTGRLSALWGVFLSFLFFLLTPTCEHMPKRSWLLINTSGLDSGPIREATSPMLNLALISQALSREGRHEYSRATPARLARHSFRGEPAPRSLGAAGRRTPTSNHSS